MTRAAVAVPALVALALALSACGGGGGSGPDKASYIARADKICSAARSAALPLVDELTSAGLSLSPAAGRRLSAVAARLHASQARYLARLRALRKPSGDEAAIDAFLTPAGQVVDAIGKASGSLARGDVAGTLSLLAQAQGASGEAKSAADAYGFHKCGAALALAA